MRDSLRSLKPYRPPEAEGLALHRNTNRWGTNPAAQEMARLIWPRMVTLGVVQAVDLVFLRLASPLPAGSIAAFFYAMLAMVAMPNLSLPGLSPA